MRWAKKQLGKAGLSTSALDAELLLAHVLMVDRVFLWAHSEKEISKEQADLFQSLVERRERHEPVAYLVGKKEFFNRDFIVNSDTLIPRPDTEHLVEIALRHLPMDRPLTVIDVCTGTGCVGISIALERPKARVILTDISEKALEVAAQNIALHGLEDRVLFRQGDGLNPCLGQVGVDCIVANPPYIKKDAMEKLPLDVKNYEPHLALLGEGEGGLSCHLQIIQAAEKLLKPDGCLALEIGYDQRSDLEKSFFGFQLPEFILDYAGFARVVLFRKSGSVDG